MCSCPKNILDFWYNRRNVKDGLDELGVCNAQIYGQNLLKAALRLAKI